jgi:hypothetical protein
MYVVYVKREFICPQGHKKQLLLSKADTGHATSHALKEFILKHKVVIFYLYAISTDY